MTNVTSAIQYKFENIGYEYLLLKFESRDINDIMPLITALTHFIKNNTSLSAKIIDVIPSYKTILLHFNMLRISPIELRHIIEEKITYFQSSESSRSHQNSIITIPVCYDEQLGGDLISVSSILQLAPNELVEVHTSSIYTCFAIGFMPGFGYLGPIPKELHIPRHTTPKLRVPAGSVALADSHTAIYPNESPGGWQIIGRTPMVMNEYSQQDQTINSLLTVGARVAFKAITLEEFEYDIKADKE